MTTSPEGACRLDPELLERYATGQLDFPVASSIEAHVTGCSVCRATAGTLAPAPALDRVWQRVVADTGAPSPSRPFAWSIRLGLPEPDAVVLRASSALHLPWLISLAGAIVVGIGGSFLPATDQRLFYLLIAPLLPTLVVAAAYDTTDPMRALIVTTPFSKLRTALLRSGAALSVALPVALSIGLILPDVGTRAFVWLLPAIALTVTALDLLTWCRAPVAAALVVGTWACFVAVLRAGDHLVEASSALAQTGFAAVGLIAAAVLGIRLLSLRTPGDPHEHSYRRP